MKVTNLFLGVCKVIGCLFFSSLSDHAFSQTPTEAWVARYDGPSSLYDHAHLLAVDESGNVYVSGSSWNGAKYDYATIKYSPNGSQLWVARYNALGYDGGASALAVDGWGDVYVAGGGGTVKYDPNGNQLWVVAAGRSLALAWIPTKGSAANVLRSSLQVGRRLGGL